MQARGFEGTFRHLSTHRIVPGAWVAFGAFLAVLVGFELAAHLVLPHA